MSTNNMDKGRNSKNEEKDKSIANYCSLATVHTPDNWMIRFQSSWILLIISVISHSVPKTSQEES